MRKAIAMVVWLVAALWVAPALAATPSTVGLAAWVTSNTDLQASQVAIAGPDNVYSVEPLGPRLPTGEVLALVRTEAVSSDWSAEHQFQSWDAHLLFDCQGGRVRVLRSTSYADRDRQGFVKADARGDGWFAPAAQTPAATLLAAACDASFKWPLRAADAAPPKAEAPPVQIRGLQMAKASRQEQPGAQVAIVRAPAAAAKAEAVAVVNPLPAPVEAMPETVAPRPLPQFASLAVATADSRPLLKANFTPTRPTQALSAPVQAESQALAARPSVLATCKRVAEAARSWVWARMEVVRVRPAADPARQQAQARPARAAADVRT
jgi:hypothetical protein